VLFKSAAIVDLAPVIAKAQRVGAPVLVDAYQWIGAIPLDVTALGADFVTGRLGQVPVRRAGRGLSLRAPGSPCHGQARA
jgi:hypothetical protein